MKTGKRHVERKLVAAGRQGPLVEQYRKLAATLHFAKKDGAVKVLMVASAVAGEGKTLTACNLALTFSESYGSKVLLIDADLRRPSTHKVFGVANTCGLIDHLNSPVERPLPMLEITPNLSLVPAGRPDPDPISALTSDRMRRVIEDASGSFDWVIIDTPPIALLPDAHLLAGLAHAALLVIRAGHTPFSLINRAVTVLGRQRIAGVVLNRVRQREIGGGYYYYGTQNYFGDQASTS